MDSLEAALKNLKLVSTLEPLGFEVATAENGREAVHLALEQRPDLVLLDLVMPEMDGLEAVKEMRLHRELDKTRIIGVSAAVTESSHRDAFMAACYDFMAKPIEIGTLLDKIGAQLRIAWETARPGMTVAKAQAKELEELTVTPPQELIGLYELAMRGDMRKIRAWATALEERDSRFSRFAGKLRELAEGFKAKAILALIEHHEEKIT